MGMIKDKLFEEAAVMMGTFVGLDWKTFDDVLAYQKKHGVNWYITKTWSNELQAKFMDWLDDYLKENTKWSARKRDWEVGCFILCYGWKVEQELTA